VTRKTTTMAVCDGLVAGSNQTQGIMDVLLYCQGKAEHPVKTPVVPLGSGGFSFLFLASGILFVVA